MSDMINRQDAIDALIKMLSDCFYADEEVLDAVKTTLNELPPAQPEPQTEINMAYMRGKIDGINYCTERLREMRMEVEHEL